MSGQGDDEQQQPPEQPGWQSQWQQPQQPEQPANPPQWGQPPSDQPQWGQQQPQWQQQHAGWQPAPRTPGSATASLILGICSIVLCPPILGPLAIVYGNKAKREIDSSNGSLGGRGMAQAGVITGWIGVAFAVIWILIIVLAIIGSS
jgi:hypothetical protein